MSAISAPHGTYPAAFPAGSIVRQPGFTLHTERTGYASITEKFLGYFSDMASGRVLTIYNSNRATQRTYKTAHPYFPSLLLYDSKITQRKGLLNGEATIEYRGLDPALSSPPPPVYSINRSLSTEPVSTHTLWNNKASGGDQTNFIAGTPSSPQHGAIFLDPATHAISPTDATGIFSGWSATSDFFGVESYLCPGSVWSESYVSYGAPTDSDLNGVGTITDPAGSPPTPNGYYWIYLGCEATDNAGLYRFSKSWRLVKQNYATSYLYKPAPPPADPA